MFDFIVKVSFFLLSIYITYKLSRKIVNDSGSSNDMGGITIIIFCFTLALMFIPALMIIAIHGAILER